MLKASGINALATYILHINNLYLWIPKVDSINIADKNTVGNRRLYRKTFELKEDSHALI